MISSDIARIAAEPAEPSAQTLRVDVIADLVCPWCYIGKRRLSEALTAVRGPRSINWIPFQLNPAMPAEGMALDDYLRQRFGDPDALRPALAELTRQGLDEGIRFRFDLIDRVPNTLDAHRLMWLGEKTGSDTSALAEQILKAFFEDGLDIADHEVLADIAGRQGIRRADTVKALRNDISRKTVLSQEAQVRKSGVSGVPDFLVNRRLFVIGAQGTAALINVFDRAMFGEESGLPASTTSH